MVDICAAELAVLLGKPLPPSARHSKPRTIRRAAAPKNCQAVLTPDERQFLQKPICPDADLTEPATDSDPARLFAKTCLHENTEGARSGLFAFANGYFVHVSCVEGGPCLGEGKDHLVMTSFSYHILVKTPLGRLETACPDTPSACSDLVGLHDLMEQLDALRAFPAHAHAATPLDSPFLSVRDTAALDPFLPPHRADARGFAYQRVCQLLEKPKGE